MWACDYGTSRQGVRGSGGPVEDVPGFSVCVLQSFTGHVLETPDEMFEGTATQSGEWHKDINTQEIQSHSIQSYIINTTYGHMKKYYRGTTTALSNPSAVHPFGHERMSTHFHARRHAGQPSTLDRSWSASLKDPRTQGHLHLPLWRPWLTKGFEMLRCWVPQSMGCMCVFTAQCNCQTF